MIDETLQKLEERIRSSERTGEGTRRELLALVGELRGEFAEIAATHEEDAPAIARQTQAAATGPVHEVEESVREFENAHPRFVGLVRSLLQTLSDAGI